jgi:phage pi2 protein 07
LLIIATIVLLIIANAVYIFIQKREIKRLKTECAEWKVKAETPKIVEKTVIKYTPAEGSTSSIIVEDTKEYKELLRSAMELNAMYTDLEKKRGTPGDTIYVDKPGFIPKPRYQKKWMVSGIYYSDNEYNIGITKKFIDLRFIEIYLGGNIRIRENTLGIQVVGRF